MLKGNPEDREVYAALAQMYSRVKDWDNAEKSIDKAIEMSSKQEDRDYALFVAGSIFERQKKYDKAEEEFDKVLADDPKNAMVLNYLGYMLADRGIRLEEALGYIRRAVALDPQNGAYRDSLGWAYYKTGDYALAEENLRRASERLNNDTGIHDHLGELYQKTGRLKLAATQWECSLEEWNKTIPAEVDADDVAKVKKELETTIAQGALRADATQAGSTACKELETTIAQGAFRADATQTRSTASSENPVPVDPASVLAAHPDWALRASPSDTSALHQANQYGNQARAAYSRGNYDLAVPLFIKELQLDRRKKARPGHLLLLGNSFAKLGDFQNAYDAYILTTPERVPPNRNLMPRLPDDKGTQAAQALLDGIQNCSAGCYLAPTYLGVAGILRHFGKTKEAQGFEEEARISQEAQDAFEASINSGASWMVNCETEAKVYDRENRPELAAAMRAYGEAHAAQFSNETVGSQANQSALSLILQGLAMGMSGAMMARNVGPPSPQRVPMESRGTVRPNMPVNQTTPSQPGTAYVSPNAPGERAPTPGSTTPVPNRPVAPSTGRNYPPPTPGSNAPPNTSTAPNAPNERAPAAGPTTPAPNYPPPAPSSGRNYPPPTPGSNTPPNTSTGIAGASGRYAPGTPIGYCNPGDGLGNTCSGSSQPPASNNAQGPPTGGWVNGDRPNSGGPLLSSANLSPAPNVSNAVPTSQPSVDASAEDTSDLSGDNQMAANSDSNNDSGGGNPEASDATPGSTGADSGWADPLTDPGAPSGGGVTANPSQQDIASTLDTGLSNSGETSATPVGTVADSGSWDAFSSGSPSPSPSDLSLDAVSPNGGAATVSDAADQQIDLDMQKAGAIDEGLSNVLPTNEASGDIRKQGVEAVGAMAHQMNHIVNDLNSALQNGNVAPEQINADTQALPIKLLEGSAPEWMKNIQEDSNRFQNGLNYVTKQVHSTSCLFFYTSSCQ
jgi:tetratricopeptide (TPR) repeat protein